MSRLIPALLLLSAAAAANPIFPPMPPVPMFSGQHQLQPPWTLPFGEPFQFHAVTEEDFLNFAPLEIFRSPQAPVVFISPPPFLAANLPAENSQVPEPSTFALILLGLFGCACIHRRRKPGKLPA